MASPKRALAASDRRLEEAGSDLFASANAVDAVVGGVLLAAALSPGVLLGPVHLLLGGTGLGLRAVDGRLRQPGLGVPRPRGTLPEQDVPAAARFAVPAMVAALSATHALAGGATWSRVCAVAAEAGARSRRGALLKEIGRRGPSALASGSIAEALVLAGGRLAGGVLTAEDLAAARPEVHALDAERRGRGAVRAPWASDDAPHPELAVIAAVDARGRIAIACYERIEEGIEVPELGLVAPLAAVPVLRGTTRVRPGSTLGSAAPIALLLEEGAAEVALGGVGPHALEALAAAERAFLAGEPIEPAAHPEEGERALVGVVRTRAGGRAF